MTSNARTHDDPFAIFDDAADDAAIQAAELDQERAGFASDPDFRAGAGSDYTAAPACKLMAARCACCGTELLQAESIEAGIGPDCRKLHGYGKAQTEPNWIEAAEALTAAGRVALDDGTWADFAASIEATRDAVKVANMSVHRIAARQRGPEAVALIAVIRAVGFGKMADRIADRLHVRLRAVAAPTPLAPIRIRYDRWRGVDKVVVTVPEYNAAVVADFRGVPGRYYDRPAGENWFPIAQRAAVLRVLETHFTGRAAVGPKGEFIIGERAPVSDAAPAIAA